MMKKIANKKSQSKNAHTLQLLVHDRKRDELATVAGGGGEGGGSTITKEVLTPSSTPV
jgi:hypothetical protein